MKFFIALMTKLQAECMLHVVNVVQITSIYTFCVVVL
jgi:hypothetical protein